MRPGGTTVHLFTEAGVKTTKGQGGVKLLFQYIEGAPLIVLISVSACVTHR